MATSQDFVNWVCSDELHPRFLQYLLIYEKPSLARFSSGAVHQTIYFPEVKAFHICMPSITEQRKIVALLDEGLATIDEAIANVQQSLSYAQRLTRSLAADIFCRAGVELPAEKVRLGSVCTLYNGRAYAKDELLSQGKTPVLRVGNFFTNPHWYYSDLELDDTKYANNGDLLYAWSASFGPRIWDGGRVIYHYHIWKMRPDDRRLNKRYLFHFLEWDKEKIKAAQGAGATMIHVTKGSMEARLLPLPSLSEQERIANTLDQASQATRELASIYIRKLEALVRLKQSLLQRAFTGSLTDQVRLAA